MPTEAQPRTASMAGRMRRFALILSIVLVLLGVMVMHAVLRWQIFQRWSADLAKVVPTSGPADVPAILNLGRAAQHLTLVGARWRAGDAAGALRESDQALVFSRPLTDQRTYCIVLLQRAYLLERLGYPSAAEAVNQELIQAGERANQLLWVAGAHLLQGNIALQAGTYEKALAELEQSQRVAQRIESPAWERLVARHLEVQVSALLLLLPTAVSSPEAAVEFERNLESLLARMGVPLSKVLSDVAGKVPDAFFWIGDRARLDAHLADRHRALKRAGDGSGREAAAAIDFEKVQCASSRERLASRSRRTGRPTPIAPVVHAGVAFERGQFDEAVRYWDEELTAALRLGDGHLAAWDLWGIGRARWYQGRFRKAIEHAAAAVVCLEASAGSLGTDELLSSFNAGPNRLIYHSLLEMFALEVRPREAFALAERARSRALLRAVGTDRTSAPVDGTSSHPITRELAATQKRLRELEREMAFAIGDQRQQIEDGLLELRSQHDGLTIRAGLIDRELGAVTSIQPTDLAQVQASLPRDVTLISYFVTDARTHAWVVERDAFGWFSLPPMDGKLSAPSCYSRAVRSRGSRLLAGCGDEAASAERLYRQLFAPLRPYVRNSKLILVPHGPLHYVPFASLRDPATGRYLVEDYTLTHAPSASVLEFLRQKESPWSGRALVLGAPEEADPSLPPLAGSRYEAVEVAKTLGTRPFLGAEASESRLSGLQGSVDLVHLAAHGIFIPQSPRFSRIALAPGGGHDGNLQVHEIYSGLDLRGVNLVVLSACDTALGEWSGGDEIVGLTRAFLYAGAPGVISTLWRIDDVASAELMTTFYRRLQAGDSAAEALRTAQLSLLRQDRYAAPYYWAGFLLTGDPQTRWGRERAPRPG